ncbi:hypothetical protein, partial [Klebsiella pneumoniae]|uniref:ATP-binding protein n=1 Tax=Klebsiella pneumoniae TaxID=573 RepID=UPI0039C2C03F
ALELGVVGLMNVQLALQGEDIYVIEVNPRASRTVRFVSKCIGVSLAMIAARVMAGKTLKEIGFTKEIIPNFYSVKEAVFPFAKFPGVDPILGGFDAEGRDGSKITVNVPSAGRIPG